jgi:hypothetical protein
MPCRLASMGGPGDDEQPTAGCQELRDPSEGVVQVEVLQHGHHGDQVSPAIAGGRTKVSEVASLDAWSAWTEAT